MTTEITKPTLTQLDEVLDRYRDVVSKACGPNSCVIQLAMLELFDEPMPNREARGGMNAGVWFISMIPKWIMEGKVELDDGLVYEEEGVSERHIRIHWYPVHID